MANEPKQNNLSLNLAQQHPHTRRTRLLQFHNDSIKTPRRQRVKTMKHMFVKVEHRRIHFSIDRLQQGGRLQKSIVSPWMGRIEPIGIVICTHQLLDRYISHRRHFDDLWIGFGTSTPAVTRPRLTQVRPMLCSIGSGNGFVMSFQYVSVPLRKAMYGSFKGRLGPRNNNLDVPYRHGR